MIIGFDANFCYLMQRYGRISTRQLVFADHNEDLLAQARKNKPGVIFLEISHADSYAWKIFKELKSHPDTSHIPVVICSWQEDELRSEQACADYYLRLPILYEHFIDALAHVGAGCEDKEL
jgi:PleD family two-component response regulator